MKAVSHHPHQQEKNQLQKHLHTSAKLLCRQCLSLQVVVQLLDPSFWGQPHQETTKPLCSASRLCSSPAVVSSTNTKEAIEGKASPAGRKPQRCQVPADSSTSPSGSCWPAAALPGATPARASWDTVVGSHETAMTWKDQPIPSSLSASHRRGINHFLAILRGTELIT